MGVVAIEDEALCAISDTGPEAHALVAQAVEDADNPTAWRLIVGWTLHAGRGQSVEQQRATIRAVWAERRRQRRAHNAVL